MSPFSLIFGIKSNLFFDVFSLKKVKNTTNLCGTPNNFLSYVKYKLLFCQINYSNFPNKIICFSL